ncbi:unnamed protein product [Paramecium pentaurelia]|uniref:Transmembrane protein n=1 Tax=Paramecium pentaurelia TaxID=43138 RepID=A0A8S1U659_9CILI|nr:unnamed protein product [Paramecium pentaurelia]
MKQVIDHGPQQKWIKQAFAIINRVKFQMFDINLIQFILIMQDQRDQLILDIKIANYRKQQQQKIEQEQQFKEQLPKIKQYKAQIFQDDMHHFAKLFFTGFPIALGSVIIFRSLIIFPFAIWTTNYMQNNMHKLYEYLENNQ